MKITKIVLYDEPAMPEICIENLASFLNNTFHVETEIRENILKFSKQDTAKKIAACRIFNPRKPYQKHIPTNDEIVFEEENMLDSKKTENIIMYDGFELQNVLLELIPENEADLSTLHVFFTNKLTCTYDETDYRYHGRALVGANPFIISTTGIIEAPAKPREYYIDLITNFTQGLNVDAVKTKYKGSYLEYHDQRLSSIIEGYLLQAVFFYETGNAFCKDKECRLFNAHWQKDLLHSQLESCKLCEQHQKILDELTII